MAGTITITANLTGLPQGSITFPPFTLTPNAAGNYAQTEITLASGANTITVPSWAEQCTIIPPTNNTAGLTFKGTAGDTGFPISPSAPWTMSLAATAASFVLSAAGAMSAITNVIFT